MGIELPLPGAEYLDWPNLKRIQAERWEQQSQYVRHHSRFYRKLLGPAKLPERIDELESLPFTDKEMLREDQQCNPPFGSYLAADEKDLARIHRTSGTSGTAMNLSLSHKDAKMTAVIAGRAQGAGGLGPGDRVVHCLNYRLWMGGYSDHAGLEETGATVVPYGTGDTAGLIETIMELGINAISCTPSYPAVLERTLEDKYPDMQPRDLGLTLGQFGGEPGLDDPGFRKRIETTWGLKARNSNYGVSDVLCNFAGQTDVCNDLHFMAMDVLLPELVQPETGAALQWQEGQQGELVLTHLCKEAQPLVRFRTGDIITITGTGKAQCGRTAPRFRVTGRSDDMIVVRGINVFPTMVSAVLNGFPELSGEYRILLDKPPPYDFLPVETELADGTESTPALASAVESALKNATGASARVTLVPPASLPRTEEKTRRVLRRYLDE